MRAPVVDDDRIYVGTNNEHGYLTRFGSDIDLGVLLCFQKSNGKLLWQHSNEKLPTGRVHDWPQSGVTSRPCVEGDRLWYVNNRAEIVCLDTNGFRDGENDGLAEDEANTYLNDADVVWRLGMMKELAVQPHNISTCTVAVWEELIFAVAGNGVVRIIKVNKVEIEGNQITIKQGSSNATTPQEKYMRAREIATSLPLGFRHQRFCSPCAASRYSLPTARALTDCRERYSLAAATNP